MAILITWTAIPSGRASSPPRRSSPSPRPTNRCSRRPWVCWHRLSPRDSQGAGGGASTSGDSGSQPGRCRSARCRCRVSTIVRFCELLREEVSGEAREHVQAVMDERCAPPPWSAAFRHSHARRRDLHRFARTPLTSATRSTTSSPRPAMHPPDGSAGGGPGAREPRRCLGRDHHGGHRDRDHPRRGRRHVQALLHHEASRRRNGSRPGCRLQYGPGARGPDRGRQLGPPIRRGRRSG